MRVEERTEGPEPSAERAGPAPGRRRPRWWSRRAPLALALAALAVIAVAGLLIATQGGSDEVETRDYPLATRTAGTLGPTVEANTSDPSTTTPTIATSTTPPDTPPAAATGTDGPTAVTGPACPPAGQGTVCVAVDRGDVDGDGDGVDDFREVGGAHCGDLVAEL